MQFLRHETRFVKQQRNSPFDPLGKHICVAWTHCEDEHSSPSKELHNMRLSSCVIDKTGYSVLHKIVYKITSVGL